MILRRVLMSVVVATAATMTFPLHAHDFWIEPSTFQVKEGELLRARLLVGQHFVGDPVPRDDSHIVQFVAYQGAVTAPLIGIGSGDPAGMMRTTADTSLLVYQSSPSVATLTPQKFEQYFREEGLDGFPVAVRLKQAAPAAINDAFSRDAKTLVSATGKGYDRVAGLPLELIPLKNPVTVASAAPLSFKLLYLGKPAANVQLVAIPKTRPMQQQVARTDRKGVASFKLDGADEWLVKAVYMRPSTIKGADCESLWASYVFRNGGGS